MSRTRLACCVTCATFAWSITACSSSDSAPAAGNAGATSAAGAGAVADGEPADLAGITAEHNATRANVQPSATPTIPPLTWSNSVASAAQAWANRCVFEHSQGQYGENIYASGGQAAAGDKIVRSWVSEAQDYDYESNACSNVCGHYTQVVWRKSLRLGCGVARCTKNSPFAGFPEWQFVVCNYDPPGNFNGQKPY